MKKVTYIFIVLLMSSTFGCTDFMNITSKDTITDDGVWISPSSIMLFISNIYTDLKGPLYTLDGAGGQAPDVLFTDDFLQLGEGNSNKWNLFDFNASSAPINRWDDCYKTIRKANLGLAKIEVSAVLTDDAKTRLMGDLYFMRGLFYLELLRFYGGVPLIDKALDRQVDEIFYARATAEETLNFIIADLQKAADRLPVTLVDEELGRATRGAAIGMQAVAYLHAAGVIDAKYYKNAADIANIFITGELKDRYSLFQGGFMELFLEEYEHNSEVIFDIQFAYPYRFTGTQTVFAPPEPGDEGGYGWGKGNVSQELVDAFEMKDGTAFDWSNPEHAKAPYENRDKRFYSTVHYNGKPWKGKILYTSQNTPKNLELKSNPNGMYSLSKPSCTKTGYYMGKHMNEKVVCGYDNRGKGVGGGHNYIVLRFAEILLTFAEAENEVNGPTTAVYNAIKLIRDRAGQPPLLAGLDKDSMRERIRKERRIELALEGKRFLDLVRWRTAEEVLNQNLSACLVTYVEKEGEIVPTYQVIKDVCKKAFIAPKNYLWPIPQGAINKNSALEQNPMW